MIIPKEIEDAIKLKEQQEFCAKLCADIPDLIEQNLNQSKPTKITEPDCEVSLSYIVDSIRNEINKRVDRYGANSRMKLTDMPCAISRPNVGIFHLQSNKFINSSDELLDLLNKVEEIKLEKKYNGPDKNQVVVVKAKLPEDYVACCAYVQARHIPASIFESDKVVAKLIKNKLGHIVDVDLLCREIPPLKSNEAYGHMSAEKVKIHYHWVTMKINKETHTLQCWFPGTDRSVADGKPKEMVLVGAHYHKKIRASKPYGGFGALKPQE